MSTKSVIYSLRGLIRDKARQQEALKRELKKVHGAATPAQMRESRKLRIEITACLNYFHSVKGTDILPEEGKELVHAIRQEDENEYWDYYSWLCDTSDDLLDDPRATICEKAGRWMTREEAKAIQREVQYHIDLDAGRVSWFQKLLHAIGGSYKG